MWKIFYFCEPYDIEASSLVFIIIIEYEKSPYAISSVCINTFLTVEIQYTEERGRTITEQIEERTPNKMNCGSGFQSQVWFLFNIKMINLS